MPSFLTVRSNVYSTSASNTALEIVTIPSLALKFREHPAAELCLQGEKNFQTLLGMGAHRVSPQPKHSEPHTVTATDLAVQCLPRGGVWATRHVIPLFRLVNSTWNTLYVT